MPARILFAPRRLCCIQKTTGSVKWFQKALAMLSPAAATCLPLTREVDSPKAKTEGEKLEKKILSPSHAERVTGFASGRNHRLLPALATNSQPGCLLNASRPRQRGLCTFLTL